MFSRRAPPHPAFAVSFPDLKGIIVQNLSFDGTSPSHHYKPCEAWVLEVGTILHVHCAESDKDADERVLLIVRIAGPEGFLLAYSLCKHEPYLPNDRHWHIQQQSSDARTSFARRDSFVADETLEIQLYNGWKLEQGFTVNLTLPFKVDCRSHSSTTVRVIGYAEPESLRDLREAIASHFYKSVSGNDILPREAPSSSVPTWTDTTPHRSRSSRLAPPGISRIPAESAKSSVVSNYSDEKHDASSTMELKDQASARKHHRRNNGNGFAGWFKVADTNTKGFYVKKKGHV